VQVVLKAPAVRPENLWWMAVVEGARTRVVWAPPATRRLQAVRSEISTMSELSNNRHLTRSEREYHAHLIRREQELIDEMAEEARRRAEEARKHAR
jgi:hypothetical protein